MDEPRYITVTVRKVLDTGSSGCYAEVGQCIDDVSAVEIRDYDADETLKRRISFEPDEARLVAKAMLACADELSTPDYDQE